MSKKSWLIVGLIILECNTIWARDILQNPIANLPNQLTYLQIVDTLNSRYQLQFSYDASLVTDTLKTFSVDSLVTIEGWLNSSFATDSSEWILLENQIIIRRRKAIPRTQNSLEFRGVVVDEVTHQPIPFASVRIEGASLGAISNAKGEFAFAFAFERSKDTIQIEVSSLGYQLVKMCLLGSDRNMMVTLKESVTELPEVSVSLLNPNLILARVIEHSSTNYANYPTVLNGFFRETILQKERYVDVTEAVVAISKPSYSNAFATEKVMVEKVRRYKDSVNLSQVNLRLEGGPFYFSRLDVARSMDFLPTNSEQLLYRYFYEGFDVDLGRKVYVISFKPINDNGDLLYTGTFYIDFDSYAITTVMFQLSEASIKRSKRYFVQSEKGDSKTLPLLAKYQVSYRPFNGQWILSYVRGELKLKISNKSYRINTTFTAVTELSITEANVGKYQIFKDGYVRSGEALSDRVSENSPLFWKDFNVIPPLKEVRMLFEEE